MCVDLELMEVTDNRGNLIWMRELKQIVIWDDIDAIRLNNVPISEPCEPTLNSTLWLCRHWFKYSDMHWQWQRNDGTWEDVEPNMNEEMLRHVLDVPDGLSCCADFEELWCCPCGQQERITYAVDFDGLCQTHHDFGIERSIRLVAETCEFEGGPQPKDEMPSHEPFAPRW